MITAFMIGIVIVLVVCVLNYIMRITPGVGEVHPIDHEPSVKPKQKN